MVDIYRDAKHRGLYLVLFTDPEGDSCCTIYQISLYKTEKKGTLFTVYNISGILPSAFYDFVANLA